MPAPTPHRADPGPAESFWIRTAPEVEAADALPDRVDVAVAGGGLAGLATALELARRGRSVVVIEADRIGGRTTGRTTGKVSLLQGTTATRVRAHAGVAGLRRYVDAQEAGAQWLARELGDLPRARQERVAYTYATTPGGLRDLEKEAVAMIDAGRLVDLLGPGDIGLPFEVTGALRMPDQAQLHPGHATAALAERIREAGGALVAGCRVVDVQVGDDEVALTTTFGPLRADRLVLATGSPILDRSLLFAVLVPVRQLVVAWRMPAGTAPPDGMYLSAESPTRSIRWTQAEDGMPVVIVGGNDFTPGRERSVTALRDDLIDWTARHFPAGELDSWWAAQDYRRTSRRPVAGPIIGGGGRVFAATGFAKWGMTNAAAAALAIAGELDGDRPSWAHTTRIGARDLAATVLAGAEVAGAAARGWTRGLTSPAATTPATIPHANARVVRADGHPVAEAVMDGRVCRVSAVCPHLGGIVQWNDAERTWDCPLHGSRFAADGAVIEGPAVHPLHPVKGEPGDGSDAGSQPLAATPPWRGSSGDMDHHDSPEHSDRENAFADPGGNYPDAGGNAEHSAADASASPREPDAGAAAGADPSAQAGTAHADDTEGGAPAPAEETEGTDGPSRVGTVPASSDHHGQDGGRDTLTAGQAQDVLSGEQEQRVPSMSQNNASDVDKLGGILVQTRADMATEPVDRVVQALRERVDQAGLTASDAEIEELARQITVGDDPTPEG